jgi:hypothetical protein
MLLIFRVKYKYHENTESLCDTSKKVSPEVNAEKTKYMCISHYQSAG